RQPLDVLRRSEVTQPRLHGAGRVRRHGRPHLGNLHENRTVLALGDRSAGDTELLTRDWQQLAGRRLQGRDGDQQQGNRQDRHEDDTAPRRAVAEGLDDRGPRKFFRLTFSWTGTSCSWSFPPRRKQRWSLASAPRALAESDGYPRCCGSYS